MTTVARFIPQNVIRINSNNYYHLGGSGDRHKEQLNCYPILDSNKIPNHHHHHYNTTNGNMTREQKWREHAMLIQYKNLVELLYIYCRFELIKEVVSLDQFLQNLVNLIIIHIQTGEQENGIII